MCGMAAKGMKKNAACTTVGLETLQKQWETGIYAWLQKEKFVGNCLNVLGIFFSTFYDFC
jgi:hypothetical protein